MSSMMKLIRRVCKIRWMNRKRITLHRKMGSRCIWRHECIFGSWGLAWSKWSSMLHFVGHEFSRREESIFGHDLQFVCCSLSKHALQCFSNLPYLKPSSNNLFIEIEERTQKKKKEFHSFPWKYIWCMRCISTHIKVEPDNKY